MGRCQRGTDIDIRAVSSFLITSINQRELTAVLLALMSFKEVLRGKVVKVLSDNISTVAYLNKLSGKIDGLYNTARAIWNYSRIHKIQILAAHLPGLDN